MLLCLAIDSLLNAFDTNNQSLESLAGFSRIVLLRLLIKFFFRGLNVLDLAILVVYIDHAFEERSGSILLKVADTFYQVRKKLLVQVKHKWLELKS